MRFDTQGFFLLFIWNGFLENAYTNSFLILQMHFPVIYNDSASDKLVNWMLFFPSLNYLCKVHTHHAVICGLWKNIIYVNQRMFMKDRTNSDWLDFTDEIIGEMNR